jgi:hypothetical protein
MTVELLDTSCCGPSYMASVPSDPVAMPHKISSRTHLVDFQVYRRLPTLPGIAGAEDERLARQGLFMRVSLIACWLRPVTAAALRRSCNRSPSPVTMSWTMTLIFPPAS